MPAFELACDTARLEYQRQLVSEFAMGGDAASVGWRLAGATEFLDVLRTLAEQPRPLPPPRSDNLKHI